MFTIFLLIKKAFNFLNSNESVPNLSISLTLSFIYALIPFNGIVHILLIILLILLNGNLLIFIFATPLLSYITPISYEELHLIGNSILTLENTQVFYNKLSTITFLNFIKWNNTVVLGAYIVSLILFLPLYFIYSFFIEIYRKNILSYLENSKIFKLYKKLNWLSFLGKSK